MRTKWCRIWTFQHRTEVALRLMTVTWPFVFTLAFLSLLFYLLGQGWRNLRFILIIILAFFVQQNGFPHHQNFLPKVCLNVNALFIALQMTYLCFCFYLMFRPVLGLWDLNRTSVFVGGRACGVERNQIKNSLWQRFFWEDSLLSKGCSWFTLYKAYQPDVITIYGS